MRSLDSITLQQFLEAIGWPEGFSDEEIQQAEDSWDSPVFRALAQRRKRANVTARAARRRRA